MEASMQLPFWNHAQDSHQLLLNFRNNVETMLPYLQLYSSIQEGAKSGKIWGWRTTAMFLVAKNLLLFLLIGSSSGYGTSEYSSTWMLCAEFLKHKNNIFFPASFFQEKLFLNLQFPLQHAVWEKKNRMDGWLPGYYYIYYRVTLYNRMHTNLKYNVLSYTLF